MTFNLGLKKRKSFRNYLELTPVRNYEHVISNDGLVNVLVPKFSDKILGKILQPRLRKPYIHANLDEFGSAVWLLLNGELTVSEIGRILNEQFGERIQPVYSRLTGFLTTLYRNGFINFNELKKG